MEKLIFLKNNRLLRHALSALTIISTMAALPASAQNVEPVLAEVADSRLPVPPSWSFLEDADQDGMMDIDEILWGMDPLNPEDGLSDLDGDEISLAWEFDIGTNPTEADTDTDEWSDSEEYLLYGTDPLDPLSFPLGGAPDGGGDTESTFPPSFIPVPEAVLPPPPPPPSLSNGDFSDVSITAWKNCLASKQYQGGGFMWGAGAIGGWTAYVGSTVEVWDAGGEKFVELDGSPGNYGIKQGIANAKAGGYILVWRQSGRNSTIAGTDPYCVRVYYMNGTTEVPIGKSIDFANLDKMQWKDNAFGFQITPAQLATAGTNPIYVAFIPTSLNTYGTLIDKVSLIPIELRITALKKTLDKEGKERDSIEVVKPNDYPIPNEMIEQTNISKSGKELNRIAHNEIEIRFIGGKALGGKKIIWSMTPWGVKQDKPFRGDWKHSLVEEHKNRFAKSKEFGEYGFNLVDQAVATSEITTNEEDGYSAVRVNVPPIGWNHADVNIQIAQIIPETSIVQVVVPSVVVIDPGHGGDKDIGKKDKDSSGKLRGQSSHNNARGGWWTVQKTVNGKSRHVEEKTYEGASGVLEKDLTLLYATELVNQLKNTHKNNDKKLPLRVNLTRIDDSNLGGYERAHVARDKSADVFLSLHFNSSDSAKTARGSLVVTRNTDNKNSMEDTSFESRLTGPVNNAIRAIDGALRTNITAVSGGNAMTSDILGFFQDTAYHPIRSTVLEIEFIHSEGGDSLINGIKKDIVRRDTMHATAASILDELQEFEIKEN